MIGKSEQIKIRRAMKQQAEIEINLTEGAKRVRITTKPASPAWYPAVSLVRLEWWEKGRGYSTQYFNCLEHLMEAMRRL